MSQEPSSTKERKKGRQTPSERKSKKRPHEEMAPDNCVICKNPLAPDNHAVCTVCGEGVCRICTDIEDNLVWEMLKKKRIPGMRWPCAHCKQAESLPIFSKMTTVMTEMRDVMKCARQQNTEVQEKITNLDQRMET